MTIIKKFCLPTKLKPCKRPKDVRKDVGVIIKRKIVMSPVLVSRSMLYVLATREFVRAEAQGLQHHKSYK